MLYISPNPFRTVNFKRQPKPRKSRMEAFQDPTEGFRDILEPNVTAFTVYHPEDIARALQWAKKQVKDAFDRPTALDYI